MIIVSKDTNKSQKELNKYNKSALILKGLIETDRLSINPRVHNYELIDPLEETLKKYLPLYLPKHYDLIKQDELGDNDCKRLICKVFNIKTDEQKIDFLFSLMQNCDF
jgi:hypothetical protein